MSIHYIEGRILVDSVTEEEERRRGELLIELLGLKFTKEYPDRVPTSGGNKMPKYLTQYYDPVIGWVDIQVSTTEDEARRVMSQYLHDHPLVAGVRYKKIMKIKEE